MGNDILFTPGETLAGKYRIERVIGAGGMGVVVAATHLELDQLVAIKFLLPRAAANPTFAERFTREARLAAKLRGEHVVRVMDVGTLESGSPYLVMEHLNGEDLDSVLRNEGPLPFPVAIDYLLQACEAIGEAHDLGIVHRDLKPRNLFLSRKPNGAPLVKVLDFGISKITTPEGDMSLTKTSDVMGSPNYMSPEQIRSAKDVDARSDIWALGVVLYELLAGRVPFVAETITQLCSMILEQRPVPLASARPDVPAPVTAAIERCLAKDRNQRFPDVRALMAELSPFSAMIAMSATVRLSAGDVSPQAKSVSSEGLMRVSKAGRTEVTWGETLGQPSGPTPPPRRAGLAVGLALGATAIVVAASFLVYRGAVKRVAATPAASAPASAVKVDPPPPPPPQPPPPSAPAPAPTLAQDAPDAAAVAAPSTRRPPPPPPPPHAPPPASVSAPPPPPAPLPPPPQPSASGYSGPTLRK